MKCKNCDNSITFLEWFCLFGLCDWCHWNKNNESKYKGIGLIEAKERK